MTDHLPLVAHRGYQRKYPENSLLAFREAINVGARFLEADIQLSADGVPFLYHDEDMNRMSGIRGAVHQYSAAQLRQFAANETGRFGHRFDDNPITSLAELCQLISQHTDVLAFIEIKPNTLEFHGYEQVYRAVFKQLQPVRSQCFIISFCIPFVEYCRQQGWPKLGVVLERWAQHTSDQVRGLTPECIFCSVESLPPEGSIAIPGTLLIIYEIDRHDKAKELLARGADMIETFDIGEMLAEI